MTLTPNVLTSGTDSTDLASYATASITPLANKPVYVAVATNRSGGASTAPTLTGCGITWSVVQDQVYHTIAAPVRRLTVFKGKNAAPTTGVLTIAYAGVTQEGCMWHVVQLDGVDAATDVVQSVKTAIDTAAPTMNADLAAFGSPSNGVLVFVAKNNASTLAPEAGYTQLGTAQSQTTPNTGLHVVWRPDPDTQVTVGWSGNLRAAAVAMEIKAASELTDTQKRTYIREIERLLGRDRRVLGRLLARRIAGSSITTPLARSRAVQATLEAKYHELLVDQTDINSDFTVVERDLQTLLDAIGGVGNPAPTPVPLVKGLSTREFSVAAAPVEAWNPGGNVRYPLGAPTSAITWATLQPVKGGPINGPGKARLDALLADTAHPMRLRFFAGHQTPDWVKDEIGHFTIYYAMDPQNGSEDCVPYWDPLFRTYYADFVQKMAAIYDGVLPLIFECAAMVVYSEPCIKQLGDPRNVTTFLANGWTKQGDLDTFVAGLDAMTAFKETRVGCSYNDFSYLNASNIPSTDRAATDQLMGYHRQLFGERAVLHNCSLRKELLASSIYQRMAALGPPISIQTGTWSAIAGPGTTTTQQRHDALIQVCDFSINTLKAHLVELPSGHNLTAPELADLDARLSANP